MVYAAYHLRDRQMAEEAWTDLFTRLEHTPAPSFRITIILLPEVPAPLDECTSISTNDAALWSLDAIYMQEVIPRDSRYFFLAFIVFSFVLLQILFQWAISTFQSFGNAFRIHVCSLQGSVCMVVVIVSSRFLDTHLFQFIGTNLI